MNGNGNGKKYDGCVCHQGMGCYTCSRWGMFRVFIAFVILTGTFFAGVKLGELKGYVRAMRYGSFHSNFRGLNGEPVILREIPEPTRSAPAAAGTSTGTSSKQ
jgi:hypothetical protein